MAAFIEVDELVRLHDSSVERWHTDPIALDQREALWKVILHNHGCNFEIWHEEDKARDPHAPHHAIAAVKRNIDRLNQARNDAMERIDERVLSLLDAGAAQDDALPLHSETVGNIIDRLSILSLKIYHMREQVQREDAAEAHRQSCRARLATLQEQRADLATSLSLLFEELMGGRKRFKVYRQMKMYNDPNLNPVLYDKAK